MRFEVRISGQTRTVELQRDGLRWQVSLDGFAGDVDAVEIAPNIISILLDGVMHEVRVAPGTDGTLVLQNGHHVFAAEVVDQRAWRGRRHGVVEIAGRQQIVAPMPGKVVRLLVRVGDRVESGQGLLVVEAMKMQNEVRSPKTGTVERLLAKEGQTVNAGEVLAWID